MSCRALGEKKYALEIMETVTEQVSRARVRQAIRQWQAPVWHAAWWEHSKSLLDSIVRRVAMQVMTNWMRRASAAQLVRLIRRWIQSMRADTSDLQVHHCRSAAR